MSGEPAPRIKGKKRVKHGNEHAKNEGKNPHWAYEPPNAYGLADHDVDCAEFDWDAVKNDPDLELWLIRAPHELKSSHLENIELTSSSPSGTLTRKQATYDVWSIEAGADSAVGAEEMRTISCLLPRRAKHGKLYKAPVPASRYLIVSSSPAIPITDPTITEAAKMQSSPRFSYPDEMLKHKFLPIGSESIIQPSVGPDFGDVRTPVVKQEKKRKRQKKDASRARG